MQTRRTIAGTGAAMLLMAGAVMAEKEGEATSVAAEEIAYESAVMPFLSNYCNSCHGEKRSKGGVTLNDVSTDLATGKDIDLWNLVLKQDIVLEQNGISHAGPLAQLMSKPTCSALHMTNFAISRKP